MPKFVVTATRTVYESFEVLVDAESKSAAELMVLENVDDGGHEDSWDVELISGVSFDTFKIN